jgi:hypothetical protein
LRFTDSGKLRLEFPDGTSSDIKNVVIIGFNIETLVLKFAIIEGSNPNNIIFECDPI